MLKLFVALLATCVVVVLVAMVVGSRLWETAFFMPHFGWGVSWFALLFGGVLFGCWRIVKGK